VLAVYALKLLRGSRRSESKPRGALHGAD
jgi:hypothetical protein